MLIRQLFFLWFMLFAVSMNAVGRQQAVFFSKMCQVDEDQDWMGADEDPTSEDTNEKESESDKSEKTEKETKLSEEFISEVKSLWDLAYTHIVLVHSPYAHARALSISLDTVTPPPKS